MRLKGIWDHPVTFWLLISVPAVAILADALTIDDVGKLLPVTGEYSARFLIFTMILTPLRMLMPGSRAVSWLMKRRRYLGVAAFGYAALHTVFYLVHYGSIGAVLRDAVHFSIWTGWLAFFVFAALAITSNDASVRVLGTRWKTLQKYVYLAAALTLLHWVFLEFDLVPAAVHFVPLIAFQVFRLRMMRNKRRDRIQPP